MNDVETIETADQLADQDIRALLESQDNGPCISIYIDTLPDPNGKDKNRIRYKDQVKQAIASLDAQEMDKFERAALVDQLEHIGTTDDFWIYQQYGLAVFLSSQRLVVRKLMARPGNRVVVAPTFHLRPALQISHDAQLHHILCVSADEVQLYIGDGRTVQPVTLHSEVPTNMAEAVGKHGQAHKTDRHQTGGDDSDQLPRFFERVDRAIWRYHNGGTQLPVLLVALSEYQGIFHEVSENGNLLDAGLERDPFNDLSENELASMAWQQVSPAVSARVDDLLERFHSANAHESGETDVTRIGPAAASGRVEALLIAQDEQVSGMVDDNSGEVILTAADEPEAGDVIDRLAKLTLRADGELWFIPGERMPEATGAAAIYRFAG